jgi:hypothetical protein
MVKKLLTAVVAFRTTIPNRPSIITLFGCFLGLLDKRSSTVNELLCVHSDFLFTLYFGLFMTQFPVQRLSLELVAVYQSCYSELY